VLLVGGTALLVYAALRLDWIVVVVGGSIVTVLVALWIHASRPLLGSQD
jgi:hypothetical protein